MKRFRVLKIIGRGAFGLVVQAQNIETGEVVAIKKLKKEFSSWPDCVRHREVQCLTNLQSSSTVKSSSTNRHPNLVELKSIFRENQKLHFVFELMDDDLYNLMLKMQRRGERFSESQIKSIMFQVLSGLSFIHKRGYFHRDMKPDNLLTKSMPDDRLVVKIADFGLAKLIRSRPPFTEYVSTRWYRAPECLLKSHTYSFPIDMFACGVVMAELYRLRPLFPGKSETDELYKLCATLGTPTESVWPEGCRLARRLGFRFPGGFVRVGLAGAVRSASPEALQLMEDLLSWNPQKRPSCVQALKFPFFMDVQGGPRQDAVLMSGGVNPRPLRRRPLAFNDQNERRVQYGLPARPQIRQLPVPKYSVGNSAAPTDARNQTVAVPPAVPVSSEDRSKKKLACTIDLRVPRDSVPVPVLGSGTSQHPKKDESRRFPLGIAQKQKRGGGEQQPGYRMAGRPIKARFPSPSRFSGLIGSGLRKGLGSDSVLREPGTHRRRGEAVSPPRRRGEAASPPRRRGEAVSPCRRIRIGGAPQGPTPRRRRNRSPLRDFEGGFSGGISYRFERRHLGPGRLKQKTTPESTQVVSQFRTNGMKLYLGRKRNE